MILAGIDIGTNTMLLLVAEVDARGGIRAIEHEQRIPRLGQDVDRTGAIRISAFDRIAWILNEYKNIALRSHAERIFACATSAVRDASNQAEFISFLKKATGIDVAVVTGEEEALLTYRGAMSGITTDRPCVVVDIGGGSTEISYPHPGTHNGNTKLERYSLQIGAVRLTERYFRHDPPLPSEIDSARAVITEELAVVRNPGFHETSLVGVAGTATTLACLEQGLAEFDVEKISGFFLSAARVEYWATRLAMTPVREIRLLSESTTGRADIIFAGTLLLNEILRHFRFPGLLVSERGLRFGLILRGWEQLRL